MPSSLLLSSVSRKRSVRSSCSTVNLMVGLTPLRCRRNYSMHGALPEDAKGVNISLPQPGSGHDQCRLQCQLFEQLHAEAGHHSQDWGSHRCTSYSERSFLHSWSKWTFPGALWFVPPHFSRGWQRLLHLQEHWWRGKRHQNSCTSC